MANKLTIEPEKLVVLRKQTHLLLLQNPNYFGTLTDKVIAKKFQPVLDLGSSKQHYEELECIDYKPETAKLGAVIKLKQPGGYAGSPCTGGSREYVRFFVDYDNNGTWTDEGLAELGVYDRPFTDALCYHVEINLNPDKVSCCRSKAVLPKVRAILSWNIVPTAGDPNFPFVWGDVHEAFIQIQPSNSIWCYILGSLEKNPKYKLAPEFYTPEFEKQFLPDLKEKVKFVKPLAELTTSAVDLKRLYGTEVHEGRIALKTIHELSKKASFDNNTVLTSLLPNFNLAEIFGFYEKTKFNTDFEELHCVSLNRDMDTLHASIQIKRKTGYNGDLCSKGGKEYVAFYMDFGTGWEYQGTQSCSVHDIPDNPAGGLWYDISLGVKLDKYRKQWCQVGKAKVKGILSYNLLPTPGDPEFTAPWGDWEECNVEIKPLPKGVSTGLTTVVLEKAGGMVVVDINDGTGLATTGSAGSLGGALNSPFYGTIELIGHIFYAAPGMEYRFLVTRPGETEKPLLDQQTVTTVNSGGGFLDHPLDPDGDGWIPYLESSSLNIVADLLGRYGAYIPGKHVIRIQARSGATIYDDPNGSVTLMVDTKVPDVQIHIITGGGDCADFTSGTSISGTYSMLDDHAGSFSISVTPNKGATVNVDGTGGSGLNYAGGTLPATGKTGTFVISTAGVPKCGYNVRIDAYDRTIVNSHGIGLYNNDIQGFCLRAAN